MAEYRVYFTVPVTYCVRVERDEEDLTKEQILETIQNEELEDAYPEPTDWGDVVDAFLKADVEVEEQVNFL